LNKSKLQKRPDNSGRWSDGLSLLLLEKAPTSLPAIGEGIIVVGVDGQLAEHWAQGYHREGGASRNCRSRLNRKAREGREEIHFRFAFPI